MTGHEAVKSPQWDRRFREEDRRELCRRGLADRKNTVEELSAIRHMVGDEPRKGYQDDNGDIYEVIAILRGSTDRIRRGAI